LVVLAGIAVVGWRHFFPPAHQPSAGGIEGVWVARVGPATQVQRCQDGNCLWVLYKDSIRQIDLQGKTKGTEKKLPSDAGRSDSGQSEADQIDQFYPSQSANASSRGWVITKDKKALYVIDDRGNLVPPDPMLGKTKVDHVASGAKHLWVKDVDSASAIYRVDIDGRCERFDFSQGEVNNCFPVPGDSAWVLVYTRATDSSALYRRPGEEQAAVTPLIGSIDTPTFPKNDPLAFTQQVSLPEFGWITTRGGKLLFRVEATGKTVPMKLNGDPLVGTIVPDLTNQGAWVIGSDRKSVYRVNAEGTLLGNGGLVFNTSGEISIDSLYPEKNPARAWAKLKGDSKSVYLLGEKVKEFRRQVTFGDNVVQSVTPAGEGEGAWVTLKSGGICFIKGDEAEGIIGNLPGTDRLIISGTGAAVGRIYWAAGAGSGVYRIDREGGLLDTHLVGQQVDAILPLNSEGSLAWASSAGTAGSVLIDTGCQQYHKPVPFRRGGNLSSIYPASDPRRGWIFTSDGVYAYGPAADMADSKSVRVTINGQDLDLPGEKGASPVPITGAFNDLEVRTFSLPGPADSNDGPRGDDRLPRMFSLRADRNRDNNPDEVKPLVDKRFDPTEPTHLKPDKPESIPENTTRELELQFMDYERGSSIWVTWPKVQFTSAFYDTRWFGTLVAFALIVGASVVVLLLLRGRPSVGAWAPLALCVSGGGAAWINQVQDRLYPGWLVGALVALFLALLATGFINRRVLRLLAKERVFNFIACLAVKHPWVLSWFFAEYVTNLRDTLDKLREDERNEVYVAIPALLASDPGAQKSCDAAAQEILESLTTHTRQGRKHVLIEAAGGRGKSALLRQVVSLALKRFDHDPSAPLPVLCSCKQGTTIENMIREGLGSTFFLSEEVFADQLLAGTFFAVFDALSESDLPPEPLGAFSHGENGQATSLLLAARPGRGYGEALRKAAPKRVVLVEPQRLTEENLAVFVEAYRTRDRYGPDFTLSPEAKAACRESDGKTYLPLLVRLAIQVGGKAESIAEIYGQMFDHLVRKATEPDLFDKAALMCVRTYWDSTGRGTRGKRTLSSEEEAPRKRVLESLFSNGVLLRSASHEFRFFHDSMQSYLTAVGLQHGKEEDGKPLAGWPELLWRAATDGAFRGRSEIASGSGTELFQMCLHVFSPTVLLRDELRCGLNYWADSYPPLFKYEDVRQHCPPDLREALEHQADPRESGWNTLRKAVDLCELRDAPEAVRILGFLYGNMAPGLKKELDELKKKDQKGAASEALLKLTPWRNKEPAEGSQL
jgi:hypothetical protein